MRRRRGNPNWFKAELPHASLGVITEFERKTRLLGLTRETFAQSPELRLWCERNKDRVYIPEWLLKIWGMYLDSDFSGAA